MRIIYSYNTFGGRRVPTDFEMRLALLSVKSIQSVTDFKVFFYTDSYGKNIFSRLFSDCEVILTDFYFKNPEFWNTGKIEVYGSQVEPFLHVDFDTVFFNGFEVPDADIVTEKLRDYIPSEKLKVFQYTSLSGEIVPKKLICSGLLGGRNIDAFQCLLHHAECYDNKVNQFKNPCFENLVALEEYPLSQYADTYKLTVAELDQRFFAHFQGEHKQERFGKIIDNLCKMYGI